MDFEDKLRDALDKEKISFHFPGHKGKCRDLYPDLYGLDTTETFGTDNLAKPEGILKESMEELAKIYGTRASYLGVGGSTMALYAGLYSLTREGQTIGLPRNSHRSLFQAAELLHLNISLIDLEESQEGLGTWISLKTVKKAPDFDVLVVASPSYYGHLAPLKDLVTYAHEKKIPVLVDEAHGSHLPFFSREDSGLGQGADITVHSVHKMLPGLTSTALLHVQGEVDLDRVQQGIKLFTTTSPSYLLMASISRAVDWMDQVGRGKILDLIQAMDPFYRDLDQAGIELLRGPRQDPLKWLIQVPGYTGREVYERLFKDYGLALEMYDQDRALAVLSSVDEKKELAALTEALVSFPKREPRPRKPLKMPKLVDFLETKDRRNFKMKKIDFREAVGLYAGDFVTLYPPGIPLLYPQGKINQDQVDYLQDLLEAGISLEGLDEKLRMNVIQ